MNLARTTWRWLLLLLLSLLLAFPAAAQQAARSQPVAPKVQVHKIGRAHV